jgi:hypothetical protein
MNVLSQEPMPVRKNAGAPVRRRLVTPRAAAADPGDAMNRFDRLEPEAARPQNLSNNFALREGCGTGFSQYNRASKRLASS